MSKIPTTILVDDELKRIAKRKELNISELTNRAIRLYVSDKDKLTPTEIIDFKKMKQLEIGSLEEEITILKKSIRELKSQMRDLDKVSVSTVKNATPSPVTKNELTFLDYVIVGLREKYPEDGKVPYRADFITKLEAIIRSFDDRQTVIELDEIVNTIDKLHLINKAEWADNNTAVILTLGKD